ncbi:Protease HtpX homolog 1 [Lactobacillus equicursoris DSM 19284 = JCM 14600 = CIP 110162]|uniref:Protease HtpX homolog n=3 Tax=Lactobacillus equicursoris TaxID=420645 RepID=K0NWF9_9LACO|nr:zinc metalloprotease HtpX [Lactobacillus equicursoris]KRL03515.1 heat shock protease [Lactobacillus equicursoris DSM 19284 = JCM 14600 = CIP 110162]MDD6406605.1 zinc metalloprotease HtpX [Lactobacillus equicursoris]MST80448.1 zinc metalloprotease HtpX [Lactobacillus equicursoris]CCK84131.1 Protease HtpX homolog 1 [Lactobacillus equicursoris 66c]CCK85211.1 Protease HtpX homolog 1 [Lactobacillus equicursoris DSM 19284 = JCM 14600 = CIP 110162]
MLYQQIERNKRKTFLVMLVFFVIFALVGAGLGQLMWDKPLPGVLTAGVIALVYSFIIFQDPISVVMSMNHAQELREEDNPQLFHVVEDMAMVGQIPMPKVYLIPDQSPNAFATGLSPDKSAVAVTQGLLDMMNREELEGVLGHEISHIRNYDIRLSMVALVLVSAISFIADFAQNWMWFGFGGRRRDDDDEDGGSLGMIIGVIGVIFTLILGPLAASLAQMALSRNREYLADAGSVELTRNPQGLISALRKIENSQPMQAANSASASLYIEDPVRRPSLSHLFDTHPPTEERIKRLEQM